MRLAAPRPAARCFGRRCGVWLSKSRSEVPRIKIDMCEMREGDCGVLNSCQTFLEGKVVVRPQRFSVGIWTIDQDVVRELHARPSTEVFVQFPKVNARQLQLRSPSVAQWHILKLNAHRYARELPVDGLCFPPDVKELSVDMYFGLWMLWAPAAPITS